MAAALVPLQEAGPNPALRTCEHGAPLGTPCGACEELALAGFPGTPNAHASVALHAPPALEMTLFEIDQELREYLDTIDCTEEGTPERAECESAIAQFMEALPNKVDRVSATYRWLESLAAAAKTEKEFYARRHSALQRAVDRLERYVVRVLEQQPQPKRGVKKLQGEKHTLALGSSEAVKIMDETQVPSEYKTATAEMDADVWLRIADECPWLAEIAPKVGIWARPIDVKKALKAGEQIAGADLETRYHLRLS